MVQGVCAIVESLVCCVKFNNLNWICNDYIDYKAF